jgi:uncharacterized protein
MSVQENVQIVKDLFAAIGRRDKQGLLAVSAENIEWIIPGEDWPLAGTHRGHAGLSDLLDKVNQTIEMSHPEPPEFIAQEDRVLVVGSAKGRIKATNGTFEDHWVFAITVRNGKATTRNDRLITLRLDEEIDDQTFKQQSANLRYEIAEAERELRNAESNYLDLEGILAFAKKIITSPSRLWLESSLDQRQRLQKTFFPDGLTYGECGFETAPISSFFRLLGGFVDCESRLASPTGFEPVLSP